jgi:hypothetical protein
MGLRLIATTEADNAILPYPTGVDADMSLMDDRTSGTCAACGSQSAGSSPDVRRLIHTPALDLTRPPVGASGPPPLASTGFTPPWGKARSTRSPQPPEPVPWFAFSDERSA